MVDVATAWLTSNTMASAENVRTFAWKSELASSILSAPATSPSGRAAEPYSLAASRGLLALMMIMVVAATLHRSTVFGVAVVKCGGTDGSCRLLSGAEPHRRRVGQQVV